MTNLILTKQIVAKFSSYQVKTNISADLNSKWNFSDHYLKLRQKTKLLFFFGGGVQQSIKNLLVLLVDLEEKKQFYYRENYILRFQFIYLYNTFLEQDGNISILNGKHLKLVNKFTYYSSNISSTKCHHMHRKGIDWYCWVIGHTEIWSHWWNETGILPSCSHISTTL